MNTTAGFDSKEVATRSKISSSATRRELSVLHSAQFIKRKAFIKEIQLKHGKTKKKKTEGWGLNEKFPYSNELRLLLVDSNTMNRNELIKRFKPAGKIKLLVVAGIFTKDPESRLDLMIVGENLKRKIIELQIRNLEAELGRELSYAIFDTAEFAYRLDMYDKLVCDVLDYPHEMLVHQGGLLTKVPA